MAKPNPTELYANKAWQDFREAEKACFLFAEEVNNKPELQELNLPTQSAILDYVILLAIKRTNPDLFIRAGCSLVINSLITSFGIGIIVGMLIKIFF